MKIKRFAVAAAACAAGLASGIAHADSYSFNYLALDSNRFKAVSGDFGSNVDIGDSVTFSLVTGAGSYFEATSGDYIWAILGFQSGATRYGDYSWNFYNDGVLVGSGSSLGEATGAIHMGPSANIGFDGDFDEYVWTGVLTGSDTGNDNIAGDIGYDSPELPGYGGFWHYGNTSARYVGVSAVPEPETYAMLMAGLGVLAAVARRRKASQTV